MKNKSRNQKKTWKKRSKNRGHDPRWTLMWRTTAK
jgi:hypothetical protein